ncbi:MAG: long-chain-fatty-acid--CoA ligase [Candidatus Acetothermia bacterium]|jgi:acyl-CoA synthetase (AMP-forming)/AMP-acid ligase II|nr:long-chain-fatty-acid--CoA ligase [Candidatus Acetothermia bacterium]
MRTLPQVLEETAKKHPDRPAVFYEGKTLTYRDLASEVERLAAGLVELGVEPGDKVAIWMSNVPEWIVAYFAVARAGGVVVPMNTRYKTHEVVYILGNSEAKAAFLAPGFLGIDYTGMLGEVRPKLPLLREVIAVGEGAPGARPYAEVLALGDTPAARAELARRQNAIHPEDCVFILYTSGTTGEPKGAMLSHHNMAENARQITEIMEVTEQDVFLLAVPFFHCFGCVMGILGAITWGAAIVPMPIFKPDEALRLVEKHRVSILYGVPTMFVLELEEQRQAKAAGRPYDVSSLRTGIMAGAPCPVEVMRGTMDELGCNVCICYGLTEASPVITMTRFSDPIDKRVETVGKTLPGVEVKVVDDARREVPLGETGELACRGYNVMLGYWKNPEATRQVIDEGGWLYSGDLATLDAEGYVRIVGRKKDMYIVGGFNVYPAEVEEVLFTHPGIQNVAVVGVPDRVMGEVGMAFIIPRQGTHLDPQEVVDFCAHRIAGFKVPRYVVVATEFPMTPSGKVQKYKLVEQGRELIAQGKVRKLEPRKTGR